MSNIEEITPVIFRKFSSGNIIAMFPFDLGKCCTPTTCGDYIGPGQSGSCHPWNMIEDTTLASPEEYQPLFKELMDLAGYKNLKVMKRISAKAYQVRVDKFYQLYPNHVKGKY